MKGLVLTIAAVTIGFLLLNSSMREPETSIQAPEEGIEVVFDLDEILDQMYLEEESLTAPSIWYFNTTHTHRDVNVNQV
jgi:hypothetical protein